MNIPYKREQIVGILHVPVVPHMVRCSTFFAFGVLCYRPGPWKRISQEPFSIFIERFSCGNIFKIYLYTFILQH